ncbi:hypothetical protein [Streptomyces sp. NPDC004042]|uniref:hypothetical protein n=1 Tax=Streptomyces sp. NPDC004042 TaxID=3154451 RepID=UPI0033BE458F
MRRSEMRLVIARDGDEVAGFTYGYFLGISHPWEDAPLYACMVRGRAEEGR